MFCIDLYLSIKSQFWFLKGVNQWITLPPSALCLLFSDGLNRLDHATSQAANTLGFFTRQKLDFASKILGTTQRRVLEHLKLCSSFANKYYLYFYVGWDNKQVR